MAGCKRLDWLGRQQVVPVVPRPGRQVGMIKLERERERERERGRHVKPSENDHPLTDCPRSQNIS